MLRRFTEKLTRDLRYRRRLPVEFGSVQLWVSPAAGLKYLTTRLGEIDPSLLRLAAEFVKPGSVIWDIGANVGLFTFASAHLCGPGGRVIAVEADDALAGLLSRSAQMQPKTSGDVVVVHSAVASSLDLRTFCIAERSRSANFLQGYGSSQTGGVAEEQLLVTVTLDWLAERLPPPDVLKVDIEGAEAEVLLGGMGLLRGKRPVLLCEVSESASREVTAVLGGLGYRIYDGEVPALAREELGLAPWNTVAIPSRAREVVCDA